MKRNTKKHMKGISRVENMQSPNGNDVPNQFIIHTDNAQIFQSYQSIIAIRPYGYDKVILGHHYDYSNTTMKYLKIFLGNSGIAETRKLIADNTYTYDEELS